LKKSAPIWHFYTQEVGETGFLSQQKSFSLVKDAVLDQKPTSRERKK
jgi:hypothetical protein